MTDPKGCIAHDCVKHRELLLVHLAKLEEKDAGIERLKESATLWNKRYQDVCQDRIALRQKYGHEIQALESQLDDALKLLDDRAAPVAQTANHTGCACRWDADDNRVATCTRHQGWLDVVSEWADRAKDAEAKLTQPASAGLNPIWVATHPDNLQPPAEPVELSYITQELLRECLDALDLSQALLEKSMHHGKILAAERKLRAVLAAKGKQ